MSWLERLRRVVNGADPDVVQGADQERVSAFEEQLLALKRQREQEAKLRYFENRVNPPIIVEPPKVDPAEQGKLQRDLEIAQTVRPIRPSVDMMLRIIANNTWGKGVYDWRYTENNRDGDWRSIVLAKWEVGQFWKKPYGYGYYDLYLEKRGGVAYFDTNRVGRTKTTDLPELEGLLLSMYSHGPEIHTYTPPSPDGSLYPGGWSSGDPFKGG